MKIYAVWFKNDPVLGDLHLDFRLADGTVPDTIVVAGVNGTGKTRVLNEMARELRSHATSSNPQRPVYIGFEDENINGYHYAERAAGYPGPPTYWQETNPVGQDFGTPFYFVRTKQPQNRMGWDGHLSNSPMDPDDYATKPIVILRAGATLNVIQSAANTHYTSTVSQTVGARLLDAGQLSKEELNPGYNPNTSFGQGLHDLLVDIHVADDEALGAWTRAHPDKKPPQDLLEGSYKRFQDAFAYIFDYMKLLRPEPVPGARTVQVEMRGVKVPIGELSTGEKQIVFRGGQLVGERGPAHLSFRFVDEPEISLHPDWQRKILGFYKRACVTAEGDQAQLFVATHSPFIVHDAGPKTRVIILEREEGTGRIRVMPEPAYAQAGEAELVEALGLGDILPPKEKHCLLVVEGETDISIIQTAWDKLRPDRTFPFQFYKRDGAKGINVFLRALPPLTPYHQIVGLFDLDNEGEGQWNGVWNNETTNEEPHTVDAHTSGRCRSRGPSQHTLLLPVPPHRQNQAGGKLDLTHSHLTIELIFKDEHLDGCTKDVRIGADAVRKTFSGDKTKFAKHVETLPVDAFAPFEPLIARLERFVSAPASHQEGEA